MNGKITDYVKIIDAIDVMVWIIKKDGTIISVNNQVTKRLGYVRNEIIGMSVLQLHPPDRAEEAMEILDRLSTEKETICYLPIITKGGAYLETETHIVRGQWEGEPVLFGLSRDVTHQRLVELKYSILFKHAPLPMLISRLDDGLIYEVNDAWKKLLLYEDYNLIGKTIHELGLYPNEFDRDQLVQKFISQGYLNEEKISLLRRDGTLLYGVFNASAIKFNHQKYWITVYTDKTEQYKLRAELDAIKVSVASNALDSLKKQLSKNKYIVE